MLYLDANPRKRAHKPRSSIAASGGKQKLGGYPALFATGPPKLLVDLKDVNIFTISFFSWPSMRRTRNYPFQHPEVAEIGTDAKSRRLIAYGTFRGKYRNPSRRP